MDLAVGGVEEEGPMDRGDEVVLWRDEDGRGTRAGVGADPIGLEMLRCGGKGGLEEDPSLAILLAVEVLPGTVWRRVRAGLENVLSEVILDAEGDGVSVSRMSLRDVLAPREAICHGEGCGKVSC